MFRLALLAAMATCVFSASAASSASAAFTLSEELCGAGKVSFCWDSIKEGTSLRELVGVEPFQVEQLKNALLEWKSGGVTLHLECTSIKTKNGEILQTEPLVKPTIMEYEAITFTGCTFVTPKSCKVAAEITTNAISSEAVNQANVAEGIAIKPAAGETLFEFEVAGEECLGKGKDVVKGTIIGLWVEPDLDLKGHELKVEHADQNNLFVGANKATLEVLWDVKLTQLEATDFWDIALS